MTKQLLQNQPEDQPEIDKQALAARLVEMINQGDQLEVQQAAIFLGYLMHADLYLETEGEEEEFTIIRDASGHALLKSFLVAEPGFKEKKVDYSQLMSISQLIGADVIVLPGHHSNHSFIISHRMKQYSFCTLIGDDGEPLYL